ncbi:MAG: hypothetical protein GQ559_03580 [Desulfobulbaceae bacterium]|nr:hypothetical protein [Desulfobulbaceae bacterium]
MKKYIDIHPALGSLQIFPRKRSRFARKWSALFCVLFLLTALAEAASAGETEQTTDKVVFLPFSIQVPGPYGYLEHGLTSILASRLTARTKIVAVHQNYATGKRSIHLQEGQHEAFAQMLVSLKARYLIVATLAPTEEQIEITAQVFSKAEGATPRVFTRSITTIDQSLQAVDELAWDIAEKIFEKQRPKQITDAPVEQDDGMAAFQTVHPDRVYKEGINTGSELQPGR